ncbi:hypothetical protein LCGC14_1247490 [marine sediment metagenome]|uniref:Uncharacterized protein n=1 Tax=marine sediment metagenome TaxID=412755 RepID=A0A0F9L7S3_9ZZZZ
MEYKDLNAIGPEELGAIKLDIFKGLHEEGR